jgi:hypothetical protein
MEKIIEKFIPGTNKQYSITSEGIVYRNYTFKSSNNIERKILTKTKGGKGKYSYISFNTQDKRIVITVNRLMQQVFKIKKPINKGKCTLINKDGNIFNNSLSNLKWEEILIIKYKFHPKIYVKNDKIDSKRCGHCGIVKNIKEFTKEIKGKPAFYNSCLSCQRERMYKSLKNDPERYKKHLQYNKNKHMNLISNYYIAQCLKLDLKELTPELIKLQKKNLTIQRQLKNNGKENQNA